ncbi:MAG: dTDP-4-dehydrorhamnose 3,5-epimerase [Bdellovibrionota bacterium]
MKFFPTELKGLTVIELKIHGDARGFFVERFREDLFSKAGLPTEFVQDNHSRSGPGVLRGLHFQSSPPQGKLVGVTRGSIWDVALDIRANSPTYGKHFGLELSDMNGKLLWIPAGFAHGFCVLGEEPADVVYKVGSLYNPDTDRGIKWDDPALGIKWPLKNPVVSARDQKLPRFKEISL